MRRYITDLLAFCFMWTVGLIGFGIYNAWQRIKRGGTHADTSAGGTSERQPKDM